MLLTWDDKGCRGLYHSRFKEHLPRERYLRVLEWDAVRTHSYRVVKRVTKIRNTKERVSDTAYYS